MEQLLQQLVNGIITGSSYALMALGLALIYGIMHVANFALGAVYMLGAFISYYCVRAMGGAFYLLSLPIVMVIATGLGAMTERFCFRPVKNAPHSTSFIVALGVYMILEGSSSLLFGESWREIASPFNAINLVLGPVQVSLQRLLIFTICVTLSIMVFLLIKQTLTGKMIRATSQNKDASALVGIDVNRMNMLAFGIGSALAAAAGCMIAPTFMVAPSMGLGPVTKAFVVIILGGLGSIRGAVLGGFLLGMVETLGAAYISSMYKDAFVFGTLVIVLIVKPTGLFRN